MITENYKGKLNELYDKAKSIGDSHSKLEFLSDTIFDFTTYDSLVSEQFASKMLEVIDCILNRTTYKYQEENDNYINFLAMVNMPFLCDKIEWGMSIRGAWFEEYDSNKTIFTIEYDWVIQKKDIQEFMRQLIEWSKE